MVTRSIAVGPTRHRTTSPFIMGTAFNFDVAQHRYR